MTPERTCIGCRRREPQNELLRIVVDGETGNVVADPSRHRPGRGAYVHPVVACIERAVSRRAVQRALRSPGCDIGALSELAAAYAKCGDRA